MNVVPDFLASKSASVGVKQKAKSDQDSTSTDSVDVTVSVKQEPKSDPDSIMGTAADVSVKQEPASVPESPTTSHCTSSSKDPRKSILKLLQEVNIEISGAFAIHGECQSNMTMPGLVVEEFGTIGLPSSDTAASTLMEKFPTGINASNFTIQNPTWKPALQRIAALANEKLGVPEEAEAEAVLHKLVVLGKESNVNAILSEEGEKEMATFGSLMVVLPSNFKGGKLEAQQAVPGINARLCLLPPCPTSRSMLPSTTTAS